MSKPLLLKLHRWIALVFALPLLLVIGSGLLLSLEPAWRASAEPGSVTRESLDAAILAAGPASRGGAMALYAPAGLVQFGGRGGAVSLDLATAAPREPGALQAMWGPLRGFHERLVFDLGWLVTASTVALIAMAPFGLLLGWPRLRNTIGGWHRLTGWALLVPLVGSPLTGLALAFGLGAAGAPAAAPRVVLPLPQVVQMVSERHDLASLLWVRPLGGSQVVRVLDAGGTARAYRVTSQGLERLPDNWWRLLHEGTWGGVAGSLLNLATCVALLGLLGTGVWIWARRKLAVRRARAARAALAV